MHYEVVIENDSNGLTSYSIFNEKDGVYLAVEGAAPSERMQTIYYPNNETLNQEAGYLIRGMGSLGIRIGTPLNLYVESLK